MITQALKRLWFEGTRVAEIAFAVGMMLWGGLHRLSTDGPMTAHVFGAGMGWITRPHLEWLFLIVGVAQALLALLSGRLARIFIAGPAFALNADVVLDVLLKRDFSSGAMGFFFAAAVVDGFSIVRNAERRRARATWSYG